MRVSTIAFFLVVGCGGSVAGPERQAVERSAPAPRVAARECPELPAGYALRIGDDRMELVPPYTVRATRGATSCEITLSACGADNTWTADDVSAAIRNPEIAVGVAARAEVGEGEPALILEHGTGTLTIRRPGGTLPESAATLLRVLGGIHEHRLVPPECATLGVVPPPPPPAPRTERLRGSGDLDGIAGDESIVLWSDGTLEVGGLTGHVTIPDASEYFQQHQSTVQVVLVNRRAGVRGVLVGLPVEGDEDPPNRWQLLVRAGATLRLVLDVSLGAYGVTPLRFPGDGTARYIEDGWTACIRADHPRTVRRDEVTLRAGRSGMMVEAARRPTARAQQCDQLAACPAVYVLGGPTPVFAGEILRNLRGASAYALQSLPLGDAEGTLRVRLAEE